MCMTTECWWMDSGRLCSNYVTVVSAAVDINCMVLFNNITRQTNMRVNLFQGLGSAKD